jgi:hypothetical protein
VRPWFGNLQSTGLEINAWILDLEEQHEPPLSIDPGDNNSLTGPQGVHEKRPGLKLFGESLGVKQDGDRFGITGKLVKEAGKRSFLSCSFLRTQSQDQRPGGAPDVSLEVCNGIGLIHQWLAPLRSGTVSLGKKASPWPASVTRPARANQTSTAMPLGRF